MHRKDIHILINKGADTKQICDLCGCLERRVRNARERLAGKRMRRLKRLAARTEGTRQHVGNQQAVKVDAGIADALDRERALREIVRADYIDKFSRESEGGLAMRICHLCHTEWWDDEETHASDCPLATPDSAASPTGGEG